MLSFSEFVVALQTMCNYDRMNVPDEQTSKLGQNSQAVLVPYGAGPNSGVGIGYDTERPSGVHFAS
jgi:hypothetical protein